MSISHLPLFFLIFFFSKAARTRWLARIKIPIVNLIKSVWYNNKYLGIKISNLDSVSDFKVTLLLSDLKKSFLFSDPLGLIYKMKFFGRALSSFLDSEIRLFAW